MSTKRPRSEFRFVITTTIIVALGVLGVASFYSGEKQEVFFSKAPPMLNGDVAIENTSYERTSVPDEVRAMMRIGNNSEDPTIYAAPGKSCGCQLLYFSGGKSCHACEVLKKNNPFLGGETPPDCFQVKVVDCLTGPPAEKEYCKHKGMSPPSLLLNCGDGDSVVGLPTMQDFNGDGKIDEKDAALDPNGIGNLFEQLQERCKCPKHFCDGPTCKSINKPGDMSNAGISCEDDPTICTKPRGHCVGNSCEPNGNGDGCKFRIDCMPYPTPSGSPSGAPNSY